MHVAVIDIGSNTARLLVASVDGSEIMAVARERRYLRLGDDVHETRRIGTEKLTETGKVAGHYARLARRAGAERLQTIVTAPGRQAANGAELLAILHEETGAPVVQLTGDDEGRLAWEGAVAHIESPPATIGVVDLGGGSCELAIGVPGRGPEWIRSFDAGALRITRAYLDGHEVGSTTIARARQKIRRLTASLDPPLPDAALVVGGTARAIGRVIGSRFNVERLEGLAEKLQRVSPESIVASHGVTPERAETLLGGTLVLAELAYRLDTELEVGRGGLREGAVLGLARSARAAA